MSDNKNIDVIKRAEQWKYYLDIERNKSREEELRREMKKDIETFHRIIGYSKQQSGQQAMGWLLEVLYVFLVLLAMWIAAGLIHWILEGGLDGYE
jgi:hypothetical protein